MAKTTISSVLDLKRLKSQNYSLGGEENEEFDYTLT